MFDSKSDHSGDLSDDELVEVPWMDTSLGIPQKEEEELRQAS